MAAPIIDHNLLTLDYWQDSVTYELSLIHI